MASNAGNPPSAPDGHAASNAESSSSSVPVARLDSLTRRGRGATSLKVKPKSTVRRSLLEREQAELAERNRLAAQNAGPNVGAGLLPGRGHRGGRWTRLPGMFGARGGMSRSYAMPPLERQGVGMASGPLGAGTVIAGNKRGAGMKRELKRNPTSTGTRRGKKGPTADDGVEVKDEERDQLYGSSTDEDDPLQGPRVNIESINLVSDDEGEVDGEAGATQPVTPSIVSRGLLPIRLDAREHVERSRGIELDPQWRPPISRAKSVAADDDGLFVPRDLELEKNRRRPKKTADVEFIRDNRVFKGVYQEETTQQEVHSGYPNIQEMIQRMTHGTVKQEPQDDEDAMAVDARSAPEGVDAELPALAGAHEGQQNVDHQGKVKARPPSRARVPKPVLETEEDRQEWMRHAEDMHLLSAELGKMPGTSDHHDTTADGDIDAPMTGEEQQEPPMDRKWGHIYLFQFPPVLPGLFDPATTEQPPKVNDPDEEPVLIEAHSTPKARSASGTAAQGRKIGEEVKVQQDEPVVEDLTKPARLITPLQATMPSGRVGKLTVHASGRVMLTWGHAGADTETGNTPDRYARMEVHRGTESAFLQDVVLADLDANDGVKTDDQDDPYADGGEKEKGKQRAGTGMACGIAGLSTKFVVTPDWTDLLR